MSLSQVEVAAPEVRAGELTAVGMRTRVLEAGPADEEEAVVFLHGGPGSANDWDLLLPRVGEFARAVAYDLPGWGESEKPSTWSYTADAYATFIAGTFHELGIRRAHLVLGDIGAGGALLWAASHPDAFASVVLVSGGVLIDFRWHVVGRLHRVPVVGDVAARLGNLSFGMFMRLYEPKLAKPHLERMRRGFGWPTRRALLRFWRAEQAEGRGLERIAPVLRALDRPALVIWGARDRLASVEQAERQRESFPSADIVVFEESFHYPLFDQPERGIETVVPFLRRQFA
jgi:pimeloyl-ACP methyl ester carboxylesterase